MYYYQKALINEIAADEPDPSAANALQEGLGGQFGEMRTMMQYLFQSFNFRGDAVPFLDLIHGIGVEEISHVELIATTISKLLDGAPEYGSKRNGKKNGNGKNGNTPLDMAKEQKNVHHFLVGAQGAMPVDAAGNPWSGSYVYNHGNLILDLLNNLMLEATGRTQKCRIYEMSSNKTLRSTVSFLIVRDEAHEMAFAKALETLGVNWGKILPIPYIDTKKFPEVRKLMDAGLHREQYHFRMNGDSMMGNIFSGKSPSNDGTELVTLFEPREKFEIEPSPERPEEFAPGLSPELKEMADALADYAEKESKKKQK